MKIYLDDERSAPENWVRTYTVEDTIYFLKMCDVEEISLDHDLGYDKTGYDVLLWLEQKVFTDRSYTPPIIHIHTANSSARIKMILAVQSIERFYNGRNN